MTLHQACRTGNLTELKYLLTLDSNPEILNAYDQFDQTPLDLAVDHGHLDLVTELLKYAVDVNKGDNKPLHRASIKGHLEILRALITQGADVNGLNCAHWTPLHYASYSGHLDLVRELLSRGADTNIVSYEGWTPARCALLNNQLSVFIELVPYTDLNAKNYHDYFLNEDRSLIEDAILNRLTCFSDPGPDRLNEFKNAILSYDLKEPMDH